MKNGFTYLEIRKEIYGLLHVGILVNKDLHAKLEPSGYYEVEHMPGIWRYVTQTVQFSPDVDKFGI